MSISIKPGCKVLYKDCMSRGSAIQILFCGRVTINKNNMEETSLSNEQGRLVYSSASLSDMWHCGATHQDCKGEDKK